ncbi:methylglutaconyl-CoA hydratase [Labilibacter sediminis]|nr:methylglutaconyl-CoA hydratase [Labilibacter sediminis]
METVSFYIRDQIAYLGLNRPEKRNALNKQMIKELLCVLDEQRSNRSFRLLILYGEGNHFCSGADLEWMKQGLSQSKTENINDAKLFNALFESLHNFPTPVICEVQKSAFGGAVGLMTCCDFVVCESTSVFGFPEVKLGIVPATIAPYILTKMGNSNARKRLLLPEPFNAQEAKDEGLIHYIAKGIPVREKTLEIAETILQAAPDALIKTKALIHRLEEKADDESTLLFCARMIANARTSTEGQEGVTAFFEKRKPSWNNEKNIPSAK